MKAGRESGREKNVCDVWFMESEFINKGSSSFKKTKVNEMHEMEHIIQFNFEAYFNIERSRKNMRFNWLDSILFNAH